MPDDQFNLNATVSQLVTFTMFFMMMRLTAKTPEPVEPPPIYVPVIGKASPLVKNLPKASSN
jgi:hypothetical protein